MAKQHEVSRPAQSRQNRVEKPAADGARPVSRMRPSRIVLYLCRRQNFSVLRLVLRENAPASIASIAIIIALLAVLASALMTNSSILVRPVAISARPLLRRTRARHFPGCGSNTVTINCLYSIHSTRTISYLAGGELFGAGKQNLAPISESPGLNGFGKFTRVRTHSTPSMRSTPKVRA